MSGAGYWPHPSLTQQSPEPGLRETLAGLRREVDGTADPSNDLRSAVAARLADQQAGPVKGSEGERQGDQAEPADEGESVE